MISVLVAFTLASLSHTASVLIRLENIGAQLSLPHWIESILIDWVGLLPTYGSLILIGFVIAFNSVRKLNEYLKLNTYLIYGIAGMLTIFIMHFALYMLMNITFIAGTRSTLGYLAHIVSGGIGGLLYGKLLNIKN